MAKTTVSGSQGQVERGDGTLAVVSAASISGGVPGQLPVATGTSSTAWQFPGSGVVITTAGSAFSPSITLLAGSTATVSWVYNGAVAATGLTPTISFGSPGTRTVRMFVTDASGYPALDQVAVFNVGYDHTLDPGTYSPSSSFDWPAQAVANVTNIRGMTSLQMFLAEDNGPLTAVLDFTGLAQLTNIEVYSSHSTGTLVGGCVSLNRWVPELNNLTTVNINPIAPNVREVRCAGQLGGTLTFVPVTGSLSQAYHFCAHSQTIVNMPDPGTQLPVVSELWIWQAGRTGALAPGSTSLTSLQAYQNSYTSLDVTSKFSQPNGYLDMHSNQLASATLTGSTTLTYIDLSANLLNQAAVDGVLATVDGWGTSNGTLNLAGPGNSVPSSTGLTHSANLTGRGWTVTTSSTSVTVVQAKRVGAGTSGNFNSNVTAGNTVFLVLGSYTTSSGTISTSNPTLGGSTPAGSSKLYDIASGFSGGHGACISAWMLPNVTGGSTSVGLSVAGAGGTTDLYAIEVSGLGATPAVDQHSSASATSGTAVDSGATPAVTSAPEFVLGFGQVFAGASVPGAGGWTLISGNSNGFCGYQVANAAGGTYEWQQTGSGSGPWSAGVVALI